MAISIEEARNKLNILEYLSKHPDKILIGDLFEESSQYNSLNFLYNITVEGKYILDYLNEHLRKVDIFSDCTVRLDRDVIRVYIPELIYNGFKQNETIFKISLSDKAYISLDGAVTKYQELMTKEINEPKVKELDDFWKRFDCRLTLILRIKYAFLSLKKEHNKIKDALFWLFFML